jgi:hypothetical protein
MVFPDKDYITFTIDSSKEVTFNFPNKKPKRIWLDVGSNSYFKLKINDDNEGLLIHMAANSQKNFKIPSTVNSITISTTIETSFNMSLLIEEWGN